MHDDQEGSRVTLRKLRVENRVQEPYPVFLYLSSDVGNLLSLRVCGYKQAPNHVPGPQPT